MTLDELIERLQDMREQLSDGDVEILVVHQPGYPLQEVISGVWMPEDDQSGNCSKCGRVLDARRPYCVLLDPPGPSDPDGTVERGGCQIAIAAFINDKLRYRKFVLGSWREIAAEKNRTGRVASRVT